MQPRAFLNSGHAEDTCSGATTSQHHWNLITCSQGPDGCSGVTWMMLWSGETTSIVFAFCLVGGLPSTRCLCLLCAELYITVAGTSLNVAWALSSTVEAVQTLQADARKEYGC